MTKYSKRYSRQYNAYKGRIWQVKFSEKVDIKIFLGMPIREEHIEPTRTHYKKPPSQDIEAPQLGGVIPIVWEVRRADGSIVSPVVAATADAAIARVPGGIAARALRPYHPQP